MYTYGSFMCVYIKLLVTDSIDVTKCGIKKNSKLKSYETLNYYFLSNKNHKNILLYDVVITGDIKYNFPLKVTTFTPDHPLQTQ